MAIAGKDILCISSIDWDFNWQGHQEIMAALAAQGNRVLFVENTGVRAPGIRDLPRLKRRFLNWWRSTKGFRREHENLFVYSPLILPFPHSRVARWVNRAVLLRSLQRWMRATGFRRPIIWTFLPTSLVVDLIDRLEAELVVYYCIADFEQLTRPSRRISRSERKLLDRADLVFVQGEELRARFASHPNVHIFPFGVNMETFRRQTNPAEELLSLKRPIIGYVGGIHRHLDLALIARLAAETEGTVVLVGPIQTDVGLLKERENVLFVGQQPHRRIPEFIRGFDVGIIPYALNEYTRTVYPTKLNEYLAMGIPVVSTDLAEIRRFNTQHGDLVMAAADADAFVEAVRNAGERDSPIEAERRGLDKHVHFVEWTADIERYYRAASVFVLPSVREGLPNARLEAMASGLPCVATRLEGVTDAIVEDGVTGRLVPPDDAAALERALRNMLGDPAGADAMGWRARQTAAGRYANAETARRYLDLYRELA